MNLVTRIIGFFIMAGYGFRMFAKITVPTLLVGVAIGYCLGRWL